ncbi:hypothetical protein G7Y89_g14994 [Cudoniella acicularis]|uniref:Uncharacterized protein n=1 Tax=Cudoniella acicularis TaxID=354080 RepID=A0A8H4QWN3_9HELO|nr:hypothetical protein G7Y89_g14994 [Cudoniella acicularis]
MWVTKIIKYSYVDDKDKEKFLESNDDKSEDSEIPYNVRPLRRSRPEIKWNIAGSVVLILIYGLSIFATVSLTRWQNIMCHADVEVATYNWRKTQHNPFPDLGVQKVCSDFDAVMKWQEEVELKDELEKWKKIVK